MDFKLNYIPVKVLLGYLLLILLFGSVAWFLYQENQRFSTTDNNPSSNNSAVLQVSNVLADLYKTESMGRAAVQSGQNGDYNNYLKQTNALTAAIDSLKKAVNTPKQIKLLDSVQVLLSKKTKNILKLKAIKSKSEDEQAVSTAITDLTKMQSSLRKLQLEDFVQNPNKMGDYERNVLKKYVAYLNQNIPDDSTNTLSKKESDSIVSVSKKLLNQVQTKTSTKKKLVSAEEKKLLQNELSISDQLRQVLGSIEKEIIRSTASNYLKREASLQKTNRIVTSAAIIGLILTMAFLIAILNDFSKSQLYKKQLEAANLKAKKLLRSREQLIATVSHDLKTPLSTIMGYSELLSNSELSNKQIHFAKNIKGSSDYIAQLVQDLLDFTQIEAGKIAIEKIPFSLSKNIQEVAVSVQAIYAQKDIELKLDIDPKLQQPILSDPFRLRQILTNLIGNAYKFTEKGTIKISAQIDAKHENIRISVADSGIGIATENQEIIFEEFTQTNDQIEKKYGGTGLGLTISKKMASILGGDLQLNSTLGQGSTFTITLPLLFAPVLTENTEDKIEISGEKKVGVLIDDDRNLLQLTTEVLRNNNYVVYPFQEANEALQWMEQHAYDFIITDIQMPVIDGFELLQSVQKSAEYITKKQPIIAVTGRDDLDKSYYLDAGFSTVIYKPYTPKILLKTISAILNQREIPTASAKKAREKTVTKLFSLKELRAFLPDQEDELREILENFMTSSIENVALLNNAIENKNAAEVQNIAHKMSPMFKQIKANHISTILDRLERESYHSIDAVALANELSIKMNALFVLLQKEIN